MRIDAAVSARPVFRPWPEGPGNAWHQGVSMTKTSTLTLDGVFPAAGRQPSVFRSRRNLRHPAHRAGGTQRRRQVAARAPARRTLAAVQRRVRRQGRVRYLAQPNRPTTRPSPIWPASAHGWRRWRGSRRVASTPPTTNAWASAGTSANAWPTPWPPRGSAISARTPERTPERRRMHARGAARRIPRRRRLSHPRRTEQPSRRAGTRFAAGAPGGMGRRPAAGQP